MRKRLLILVVCAAIVASLVPSYVWARVDWGTDIPPVISSFSASGATVDYIAHAGPHQAYPGYIWGYVYTTLHAAWYCNPDLIIGAGVRYQGYPIITSTKHLAAAGLANPTVYGNRYAEYYTAYQPGWDVILRMVLKVPPHLFDWNGDGKARCLKWSPGQANLSTDYVAQTTWTNYAKSMAWVELLLNFMYMY